jgi:DNA-binding transcriptional ArsR family regulator
VGRVWRVDLNKARMRWVVEALIGLCVSASEVQRFTASELARQLRLLSNQAESDYEPRRATYDLKKLRAKNIVQRIGQTRRYKSTPQRTQGHARAGHSKELSHKAFVSRRSTPAQITWRTKSQTHR